MQPNSDEPAAAAAPVDAPGQAAAVPAETGRPAEPASNTAEPVKAAERVAAGWWKPEVLMLGVFSAVGLLGFLATFILIAMRGPDQPLPAARPVAAAALPGVAGPAGERGPPGPRGAPGDSGVRIVRADCATGNCTAECADDEVLLIAYCNPNRTAASYPAENSALCRATGRGRVEAVAACAKARR